MPGQRRADGVDDIVQEIGLISRMAVGARNHPIGAAGSHHIHPGRSQVGKQTPAGATVSRRLAVQLRLVNRLMVAGFNGPKGPQAATGQLIRPVLGGIISAERTEIVAVSGTWSRANCGSTDR